MLKLNLVSQSPRRRDLLDEAGFEYTLCPVKVSEIIKEKLNLPDQIMDLAKQKTDAARQENIGLQTDKSVLLLSADTVVVFAGKILGKPKNQAQAFDFLGRMSGQMHEVITGVCLWQGGVPQPVLFYDKTKVWFKDLSDAQILEYIETGEPMDKAGAYGIQGKGAQLVKDFQGSWTNVVGLPMERLQEELKKNGWYINKRKSK